MLLLFSLKVDYFIKANVKMWKSPEVARFLKYNLKETTYPSLPPFLFPSEVLDIMQAFHMDVLVKVCVFSWGPDASILIGLRNRHLVLFCVARAGPWATRVAH